MVSGSRISERRLISLTDIKGDNIFQEIGDVTRLDRYVQAEIENPSPRKFAHSYPIYRSRPLELASQLGIIQLGISAPPSKETSHATVRFSSPVFIERPRWC